MKNLVALATLLIISLLLLLDTENTAPGPLAAVHFQVPELQGRKNCTVCHGEDELGMAGACQACHEVIGEQLGQLSGFHGQLETVLATDCKRCHSEHLGESFVPVSAVSFALAGIQDRDKFDHAPIDWALTGSHDEQTCDACHENADIELLLVGEKRFLGLDQECTACHEDSHEGSYGSTCADCHGQESAFELVANFEHHPDYPLEGAHTEVACAGCHEAASEFEVATLLADSRENRVLENARESCRDCHENQHDETFLVAASLELNVAEAQVCASCHSPQHETFRGDLAEMTIALHATTGFPIGANHAEVECAKCHEDLGNLDADDGHFARAFPGRESQSCGSCHEDPHKGYYGKSCTECHGLETPFAEVENFEHHPDYPLVGGHAAIECIECHEPGTRFGIRGLLGRGVPQTTPELLRDSCRDCHDDPHSTTFTTGVAADLGIVADQTCANCHDAEHETFRGNSASLTAALHACAGFSIEAPHDELSCADCHVDFDSPAVDEGYFARAFPGRERRLCQACHEDPHSGQFEEGLFASGCIECHAESHFVPTQFGIDLHERSSFALDGAHMAVSCVDCHDAGPETIFADAPSECAECHDSPHEGRFEREALPSAVEGREGCARCHATVSFNEFTTENFDHQLWTEFELVGNHFEADCAICHQPVNDALLGYRSFGPAPGNQCIDCHEDVHLGQFEVEEAIDCSRCHEAQSEEFLASLFDHDRDSQFELGEAHVKLECSACHLSYDLPGERKVIRYIPLGKECIDCHEAGTVDQ